MPLPKRRLGSSGLELTTVGFGAWAIGGGGWSFGWGPQDDELSIATMRRALDLGINWIDTAAVYGLGHSEEIVGRLLRELPKHEHPLVFTKCGLIWDENDRMAVSKRVLLPDTIRRECEAFAAKAGCRTNRPIPIPLARRNRHARGRIVVGDGKACGRRESACRRSLELQHPSARTLRENPARGFASASFLTHSSNRGRARNSLVRPAPDRRDLLQPNAIGPFDGQLHGRARQLACAGRLAPPGAGLQTPEAWAKPRAAGRFETNRGASPHERFVRCYCLDSCMVRRDCGHCGRAESRASGWVDRGCVSRTHSG